MAAQPNACSYSFTKSARLLSGPQFQRIFNKATYKISHRHLLILASDNDVGWARLGLVIAKKHIRNATQRNRIKRHIRETFRLLQHKMPHVDAIVLARSGLDSLDDATLHQMLNQQWARLQKKVANVSSSSESETTS